jgi:hypothetical protein
VLALTAAHVQARNLLSEEALLKLKGSRKQAAAAAAVDPAKLPPEEQLPQIMQLLHSKHVVSTGVLATARSDACIASPSRLAQAVHRVLQYAAMMSQLSGKSLPAEVLNISQ